MENLLRYETSTYAMFFIIQIFSLMIPLSFVFETFKMMISNIFQPWYMFISQISKNGWCTFKQEKTTQRRCFINKRRKWKSIVKCKAWEILGNCIFRHFRRTNSFYCQTLKHRTERTKDGNRMFFIWFCKQRMNKSGNRLLEE